MRNWLRKNYPKLWDTLKTLYSSTSYYKKKVGRIEERHKINKEITLKHESIIMEKVFNSEYIVQNGPFRGMKYIKNSSGSALLPKILGSYEEPIHSWVENIIKTSVYTKILDIGCAEGYYAVGFAQACPKADVIAYDLDQNAIVLCQELALLNKVSNITFKTNCDHLELNKQCVQNTLIFCDIEGTESYLLDIDKAEGLKQVDLIVESHDCFVPEVSDLLIDRFYNSHTIHIVVDYPFRIEKYSTPNPATQAELLELFDEKRPKFMKFLFLKSKENGYVS
ncbi:MAG: methyltransferase domain-containing protein [Candidatus Electrothrix sp. MAN1_4]|nr:methyltransferase domain-containing protein [Candidatus Electrothrix sp. MAN1_4]